MMNTLIQLWGLISLSFSVGLLLRWMFDQHRRVLNRFYDAIVENLMKLFQTLKLFVKKRIQNLRISIVRVLIGEIFQLNIVSSIARAQNMDGGDSGVTVDELLSLLQLTKGESVNYNAQPSAVKTAFKVCDTVLFEEIIAKVPRAQERILLAFDQIEERAPYDSIKNEAYRKFIRE